MLPPGTKRGSSDQSTMERMEIWQQQGLRDRGAGGGTVPRPGRTLPGWTPGLALGLGLSLAPIAAQATSGPTIVPVPGLRFEIGPHLLLPQPNPPDPLQPADPLALPDRGAHLTLGLQLQVAVLFFRKSESLSAWGLFPELGYMYQRRDLGTTALFNAGLGLGYMPSPWLYIAYIPRFVVGRVYGADADGTSSPDLYRTAIGLRHGPQLGLFAGILQLELSHQLLSLQGRTQHELVALVGLDLFRLAVVGVIVGFRH